MTRVYVVKDNIPIDSWKNFYAKAFRTDGQPITVVRYNEHLKKYHGVLGWNKNDNNRYDCFVDFETDEDVVRFAFDWS